MTLIKSISGIRGTIGGEPNNNLTPIDLVALVSAYAQMLKDKFLEVEKIKVVLGRDGRISGQEVYNLVRSVLCLSGIDVLGADFATTPTVEMSVIQNEAQGGIIISASHNPKEWNALKLLNEKGEFLDAEDGKKLLELAQEANFNYPSVNELGSYQELPEALDKHIEAILALDLVDQKAIANRKFKVVVDGINSVGAKAVPALLSALGVEEVELLNGEMNGQFAHNPEPLKKNLGEIMARVKESKADMGIVVDPDVDRLAFINEKGEMFGEEYTLVAAADYVMHDYCACFYQKMSVSNMSSSRALQDITEKRGGSYFSAPVGEVNVVKEMKDKMAVIGGEGNGGVILPDLHYGRDALVGIALILSALAQNQESLSEMKDRLPQYEMIKDKVALEEGTDLKALLEKIKENYKDENLDERDGLKVIWSDSWLHLRASNTEPIIRIYAEAKNKEAAQTIVDKLKSLL